MNNSLAILLFFLCSYCFAQNIFPCQSISITPLLDAKITTYMTTEFYDLKHRSLQHLIERCLLKEIGIFPAAIKETTTLLKSFRKPLLIVTHANEYWDQSLSSKDEIDRLVSLFSNHPDKEVLFLKESFEKSKEDDFDWFTESRTPDYAIRSGGELDIPVRTNNVTIVGGGFGACHGSTVRDVVLNYQGSFPLIINLPMKGIFLNDSTLYEIHSTYSTDDDFVSDMIKKLGYHPNENRFLSILNSTKEVNLTNSNYKFIVSINNTVFHHMGNGKNIVNINFSH